MHPQIHSELSPLIDFDKITHIDTIQSLWSGYGQLLRIHLSGAAYKTIIAKRITPPVASNHPRGWNSNVSHQRKLRSYEVELNWYLNHASKVGSSSRMPALIGHRTIPDGTLFLLEDLDAAGYHLRKSHLSTAELKSCLSWLANFHAHFMGSDIHDLWETGTYWQLETRLEELEAVAQGQLKSSAWKLHEALNNCRFKTLVHGDAKYANFCFSPSGDVAAVDFQYVGGGCGMKDVAYLLSCISGGVQNEELQDELLAHYFKNLQTSLLQIDSNIDFSELEKDWRMLYPIAWADFERFLQGWAPGHWKLSAYSLRMVEAGLKLV